MLLLGNSLKSNLNNNKIKINNYGNNSKNKHFKIKK